MLLPIPVLVLAGVVASFVTAAVQRHAQALGTIQVPNERSSHTAATPTGGGIGIVAGGTLATAALAIPDAWQLLAAGMIALLVAVIGLVDDRRPLPARIRLIAQLVLVGLVVARGLSLDQLTAATGLPFPSFIIAAIAVVASVYWINLFNFMDGIDGIAGSQAIFMCLAAAFLMAAHVPGVASLPEYWMLLAVAAATAGFLILNWPPAKIFMGDAGSTYLGFIIAALGLVTIESGGVSLAQWSILAAAFVTDATVTLVCRLIRRERVFAAHRRHAYQRLSRRWKSHGRVTLTFIALNVLWLLPLSWLAAQPGWMWWSVALAYVPLAFAAIVAGAGAPEAAA